MGTKTALKIVPPDKKKCIWMEAGVVSYKLCDNNYDCQTCNYDDAMQIKISREKNKNIEFTPTWVEQMLKLPANRRKCRYMLSRDVARKICANAYECGNCSYDQVMQEKINRHLHHQQ